MSLFSHPWCLWAPYCSFSPDEMPRTPGLGPSPPAPALRPETQPPLHTSVDLLSHLTPRSSHGPARSPITTFSQCFLPNSLDPHLLALAPLAWMVPMSLPT